MGTRLACRRRLWGGAGAREMRGRQPGNTVEPHCIAGPSVGDRAPGPVLGCMGVYCINLLSTWPPHVPAPSRAHPSGGTAGRTQQGLGFWPAINGPITCWVTENDGGGRGWREAAGRMLSGRRPGAQRCPPPPGNKGRGSPVGTQWGPRACVPHPTPGPGAGGGGFEARPYVGRAARP